MRKLFSMSICLLFLLSAIAIAQEQPTSTRDAKDCYEQCGFGPYKDCLAQGGSDEECYKKAYAICETQCKPYEIEQGEPTPSTTPTTSTAPTPATTQSTTPTQPTTTPSSCKEECSKEFDQCTAGEAPPGAPDCLSMRNECEMKCGYYTQPTSTQPAYPPTTATEPTPAWTPSCDERCKKEGDRCVAEGGDKKVCEEKYWACYSQSCKKPEPSYPVEPTTASPTSPTSTVSCEDSCYDIYSDEACVKQNLDSETCKNKRFWCLGACERKPEYPGGEPTPTCPVSVPTSTCETSCSKMYYECSFSAKSLSGIAKQQAMTDCGKNVGSCLDSCAPAMETATCEDKCGKIKDYCAKEGIMEMTCGLKIDACLKECVSIKPRMTCEDSCISVKDECLNKGLDEMTCGEYVNTCLAQCSWQEQEYKKPENCKDLCTKYDASCLQGGNEPEACRITDEACITSCETGNAQQILTQQQEQVTVQVPASLWEKFKRWLGGQ